MLKSIANTVICLALISSCACGVLDISEDTESVCDMYDPSECKVKNIDLQSLKTVEDFDECAPALLPVKVRNYYFAPSGRRLTYLANLNSYKRFAIRPRVLRDVSDADTSITVLGEWISSPIGLSPTSLMKLAHPEGEIATVRAVAKECGIMIASCLSSVTLEEMAKAAIQAPECPRPPVLWLQIYIFKNRQEVLQMVHRAERAGYTAIVATIDSPMPGANTCNDRDIAYKQSFPNLLDNELESKFDPSLTFEDLTWLTRNTELPVVAKGILSGRDAVLAVKAGAAAILVSNHGGRQLDSDPPTINVLPEIVNTLKACCPSVEVYVDGGVRNGFDVYKAIARGARAVFVGRPAVWGLTVAGEDGVRKVLSILKSEFNTTMMLAGSSQPSDITEDTVIPGLFN